MGRVETQNNIPQHKVKPERTDAVVEPAKDGPDTGRDEEGGPGVQAMVEEFPERPAGPGSSGLLPIYSICSQSNLTVY